MKKNLLGIIACGIFLFPFVGNAGGYIPSSADSKMAYQIEQMYDGLSYQEKISLVQDLQEFRRTSRLNQSARYLIWFVETLFKLE